jgi:integrase/recombinase XerD
MQLKTATKNFIFHCQFEKNLSEKTIRAYSADLTQFKKYEKQDNAIIGYFDKVVIKNYIKYLYSMNYKAKTIKRKIATIKAFFSYLEFDELITITPFRKIRIKIQEPKTIPQTIDAKHISKLLKLLYLKKDTILDESSYKYKTITRDILSIEILFSTGIRVSELCSITIKDINYKTGVIKVNGKGNKERYVYICHNEIKKIAKEYIDLCHTKSNKNTSLLINRIGNKISEQSIRLMLKKYQKLSNIKQNITPHMFRHSFATMLLEENVDIRYIQNMLGHSSIITTQIYTQTSNKQQQKILNSKHPRRKLQFFE